MVNLTTCCSKTKPDENADDLNDTEDSQLAAKMNWPPCWFKNETYYTIIDGKTVYDKNPKIKDHYAKSKDKKHRNLSSGSGSFGIVSLMVNRKSGKKVAVKAIEKIKVKNWKTFVTEINIQKTFDHPHIVKLIEVFEDNRKVYLVMEYCKGGELFDRITKEFVFEERHAAMLMQQIMSAVRYMHQKRIMHRDLKPGNLLFAKSGVPLEKSQLKIIDFGLARLTHDGHKELDVHTKCGTPYYVAPEVLKGHYSSKCDVWSMGVLCFILLTGHPPFYSDTNSDISEIMNLVRGGFKAKTVFNNLNQQYWAADAQNKGKQCVSYYAQDAITAMLTSNTSDRPTAEKMMYDPWFKEITEAVVVTSISNNVIDSLKSFKSKNAFQKKALQGIAQNVSSSGIEELKALFETLDADGDGTLTVDEIKNGVEHLNSAGFGVGQDVVDLIKSIDTDGSGEIDYTEWLAATIATREMMTDSALWEAFCEFDTDGSGAIDASELKACLGSESFKEAAGDFHEISDFTQAMTDEELQAMLEEVDVDGNGEIDFIEFQAMVLGETEKLREQGYGKDGEAGWGMDLEKVAQFRDAQRKKYDVNA